MQVARDDYYRRTFCPSAMTSTSFDKWPKLGESMTSFLTNQRNQKALDFIDQNVKTNPKVARRILESFKSNSNILEREGTASQTNSINKTQSDSLMVLTKSRYGQSSDKITLYKEVGLSHQKSKSMSVRPGV